MNHSAPAAAAFSPSYFVVSLYGCEEQNIIVESLSETKYNLPFLASNIILLIPAQKYRLHMFLNLNSCFFIMHILCLAQQLSSCKVVEIFRLKCATAHPGCALAALSGLAAYHDKWQTCEHT